MKCKLLFLILVMFLCSCKKKPAENLIKEDYYIGHLEVFTDESFKSAVDALAMAYQIRYPEAHIDVLETKEDFGFLKLMEDKAKLIVMSHELNQYQISEYEQLLGRKYQPARFAMDGLVFVVGKNSTRDKISVEEIKNGLNNGSVKFIFDGGNTGNISFMAQKLNKKQSELKFKVLEGNEGVIDGVSKLPDVVGVISLNTISRIHNKKSMSLRNKIKILPVESDGLFYYPTLENIRTEKYPYTRMLYFLVNERGFKLANGLVRFAGSQTGQKVIEKEGLQPYYLYKREVEMR